MSSWDEQAMMDILEYEKTAGLSYKKKIVYTEDGVPVYTLYLGNIPQKKSEFEIKQYFSSFGDVISVNVVKKNRGRANDGPVYQYGFVTFAEPECAAKALHSCSHSKFSKRLKVKAADTWKQPKAAQELKNNDESMVGSAADPQETTCSTSSHAGKASIMELNDDCLRHIFSFLSQNEMLKLPFVCQRFYGIIEHIIRVSKYLDFDGMHPNFTLMETRSILSSFGEHIRRLRLSQASEKCRRYIEFIAIYCRHLEEMEFDMFRDMHTETYKRIFLSAKQLKKLTLEDCDVNDQVCALIGTLQNLEFLDLSHNHDITGKHLKKLVRLKELNLSNCENVENSYFIDICQATKLKSLNIVGCYQLSDEAFNALIATQTELERLAISNSYGAYRLEIIGKMDCLKHVRIHREGAAFFSTEVLCDLSAQRQEAIESLELYNLHITTEEVNRDRILKLRNLRKLCIVRDRFLDDNFLGKIAKHCKNIEELNIAGSSNLVTEVGITDLVGNLKNLKHLDVSQCSHISYSLVNLIYNVLESRQSIPSKPLTICVCETPVAVEYLKEPEYHKHKKLITLSVELDPLSMENYDDDLDDSDDNFSDMFDNSDMDPYTSDDDYDLDNLSYAEAIFFL